MSQRKDAKEDQRCEEVECGRCADSPSVRTKDAKDKMRCQLASSHDCELSKNKFSVGKI